MITFAASLRRASSHRRARTKPADGILRGGAGPGRPHEAAPPRLHQAPAPTFANFVPGGNAELAHALESRSTAVHARACHRTCGAKSGAGKTHLLRALSRRRGAGIALLARRAIFAATPMSVVTLDDVERLHRASDRSRSSTRFNERGLQLARRFRRASSPRDVADRAATSPRASRPASPTACCALTDDGRRARSRRMRGARGFALCRRRRRATCSTHRAARHGRRSSARSIRSTATRWRRAGRSRCRC